VKHLEQKQRDGFDPWNRQDKANEALQHSIENPNGASFVEDEAGLVNAYKDATSAGVYYDPATKTEYVKGSVTGRNFTTISPKSRCGETHETPSDINRQTRPTKTFKLLESL
jgi:hypothetical protein